MPKDADPVPENADTAEDRLEKPNAFATREESMRRARAYQNRVSQILRANRIIAFLIIGSIVVSVVQAVGQAIFSHQSLFALFTGTSNAPAILSLVYFLVTAANVVGLVMLVRFDYYERIHDARMVVRALVVLLTVSLLLCVVINGIIWFEATYLFQFLCAVAYQLYNDPNLDWAASLKHPFVKGRAMRDRSYERDPRRKSYIPLNFFNLFWIFIFGSILGLCVEMVFCAIVNHVWASRAGLLWGPFSPIYGFGAVLLTLFLNRFWSKPTILIFAVSAVIGAAFEFFVSWYMEMALGVVAWSYSGSFLNLQGRTDLAHAIAWGMLGVLWVRTLLPDVMRLINLIQVKWRAIVTVLMLAFMIVDGSMTVLALDCWSQRRAGLPAENELQQFYAQHYDDQFMAKRFSTMGMSQEGALHAQQNKMF